jgi:hypothetical protein
MKSSLSISVHLLLVIASSLGCTRAAYERLEERSLPRYQQGVPVMSNIASTCKRFDLFEPGDFKLSYDRLEDLTVYPTSPQYPPRFDSKYCINGGLKTSFVDLSEAEKPKNSMNIAYRNDEVIKYAECISYSAPNACRKFGERKPNTDPSKGALKAWPLVTVNMDGLNWKSLMVHFNAVVVEGDKLPLGGTYSGVFNDDKGMKLIEKEKLNIDKREWEHFIYKPYLDPTRQDGRLTGTAELYKTKIGNYTLFVKAGYAHQITNNPDWLAKRRAFLRQWVETFKIEPLPADYKKTQ